MGHFQHQKAISQQHRYKKEHLLSTDPKECRHLTRNDGVKWAVVAEGLWKLIISHIGLTFILTKHFHTYYPVRWAEQGQIDIF